MSGGVVTASRVAPGHAGDRVRSPRTAAVVAGVSLLVAAAAGAATVAAARAGGAAVAPLLADPGPLTRWGVLLGRVGYDLAAAGTLGLLLVALLLPAGGDQLTDEARRLVRTAGAWAWGWAGAAAAGALLGLSDAAGLPVWRVLAPDILALVLDLPATRSLLISAWVAALVAMGCAWFRTRTGVGVIALAAVGGLLPTLITGHAGHGDRTALSVATLSLHVVAAAVWIGGLAALVVHLRRSDALPAVLARYSPVALACFAIVAVSGTVGAWLSLPSLDALWTTAYGRLLVAKIVALVLLGAFGYRHRSRTIAAARAGRRGAFVTLAIAEIVLMAATAGLATGLARTDPNPGGTHGPVAGSPVTSPDV